MQSIFDLEFIRQFNNLLILALGASLWVILVGRILVTLAILAAMAALTRPDTRWGRRLARS